MSNQRIVYVRPEDGGISVIIPAPGVTLEQAATAVPQGLTYKVMNAEDLPADRTFRNAWCDCPINGVAVDVPKAKSIAHDKRRAKRAEEFAPLDIQATIPAQAQAAEAARQAIRDKYAAIQTDIDAAATPEELLAIVQQEGL